jgi:hypothetical protein
MVADASEKNHTFNRFLRLPKVGFLVGIENHADPLNGILTEDFRFLFTESGISYFKNVDVRRLDNVIGDIEVVRSS